MSWKVYVLNFGDVACPQIGNRGDASRKELYLKNCAMMVLASVLFATPAMASGEKGPGAHGKAVPDSVIGAQRGKLAGSTKDQGFGPQSPRDIGSVAGQNSVTFQKAPAYARMNLCNIHFHKNAEHKGGEFTTYAGNGDGNGYQSGYKFDGPLTPAEIAPVSTDICPNAHGALFPGDTIEVHYVYSTARVKPGPTLGACLNESIRNPQLRVEAQVYVLVNDKNAQNFGKLVEHGEVDGFQQARNIPSNTGEPVQYAGSTTGPSYNEKGSPFQVSWSVRPKVAKVDIATVGVWCKGNVFQEDHAHGVRNLVRNPELLSKIH
jgi:hypothetical protein